MSFAADTKSELCKQVCPYDCCAKAECYGILLFAKQFSLRSIAFSTEHRETALRLADLITEQTQAVVDISAKMTRRNGYPVTSTVTVPDEDQRLRILQYFGHTGNEVTLRINRDMIQWECCLAAFLRRLILSRGTITNPEKEYHLEFVVPYMNLANDLKNLLTDIQELELQPAVTNRKGSFIVYIKGSEGIENLLTFMGATNASMNFMQVKMFKEVRNQVNRKTNFETANIDKTVSASAKQIAAIETIIHSVGLQQLPLDLQELASLRYENPEMSLRELGEQLSEPISRSGINHRLKRIMAFADSIGKKN